MADQPTTQAIHGRGTEKELSTKGKGEPQMDTNERIEELRCFQNSAAGSLPEMATKGTKTQKE